MIIKVHKTIILRDNERTSISERVRQINYCPYNDFNSVRLMRIQVIESQNPFY